eukprot:scaffold3999_cov138-Skeletonema_dohrnii-CCMP3373.AAC.36
MASRKLPFNSLLKSCAEELVMYQQGAASGCNRHREQNNRCTLINRAKRFRVRYRANLPAAAPLSNVSRGSAKAVPDFLFYPVPLPLSIVLTITASLIHVRDVWVGRSPSAPLPYVLDTISVIRACPSLRKRYEQPSHCRVKDTKQKS